MRISHMFREGQRLSVRDLASYFEVSERTIKRDLEALRDQVGMSIVYDPKSRWYRADRDTDTRPPLTSEEFAILSLASELLTQVSGTRGTRFEATLRQALEKIALTLPSAVSLDVEAERRAQSFGFSPLRGERELVARNLATLHEAIQSRTTVEMRYFTASRGVEGERRLDPFHLRYQGDSWYAIGFCHVREDVRTFAVQRMDDLRKTLRHFKWPKDFDLKRYLAYAWNLEPGEPEALVVRFGPHSATYIRERPWHSTQEVEDEPDGGLVLRAWVHCGGEVLRWVLQHGADAEVLGPAHLREAVAREARGMGERYGG